jgi:phosphatidylserine decarboxylase
MSEGKVYDQTGPGVKAHIKSFIDTYELPLDELLVEDLDQYPVCDE